MQHVFLNEIICTYSSLIAFCPFATTHPSSLSLPRTIGLPIMTLFMSFLFPFLFRFNFEAFFPPSPLDFLYILENGHVARHRVALVLHSVINRFT